LQTGKNSNNHYFLALSGFEVHGKLYDCNPIELSQQGLALTYSYDFDANGLFCV
jgi:hypothetical protein